MKKSKNIFALLLLLSAGCSRDLSSTEAEQLIVKSKGYPREVPEMVFCGDAVQAQRMLDAGLEKDGLVKVLRSKGAFDADTPWISFTGKAARYLMPTGAGDKGYLRQNVKVAEESFKEIRDIEINKNGNTARVVYYTSYGNPTPFAVLFIKDISKPVKKTAYLIRGSDGWKVSDKALYP